MKYYCLGVLLALSFGLGACEEAEPFFTVDELHATWKSTEHDDPLVNAGEDGWRCFDRNYYYKFSSSGIDTVIVCALTTNLKHARSPWNVLLRKGEANLPRQSVVNVSQMYTVDKRELKEKIGALTRQRIRQIFQGIRMIMEPTRNYYEL